jgi:hypothetical protein
MNTSSVYYPLTPPECTLLLLEMSQHIQRQENAFSLPAISNSLLVVQHKIENVEVPPRLPAIITAIHVNFGHD